MLACALAAGVLFARVADRSAVLVVSQPVRAGQVIESAALGERLVGSRPGGSTIAASERSAIVGRTASVDLVAGSLLAPGHLADGPVAGTGRAVIGATLKEGQYPVELSNGDRVLAVVIPPDSSDAAGAPTTVPAPTPATVVGVRRLDDGSGIAISLAVAPDRSPTLAIAGAKSRLTIVLAAR